MRYQVTYRLHDPGYMPGIARVAVSASSHRQLEEQIARLRSKWEKQGYLFQVLAVRKMQRKAGGQ